MVDLVLDALGSLPEAAFLDIGANIGVYTVAAATLRPAREVTGLDSKRLQVVAVDADLTNLAYIKESLRLNRIDGRTRLLHNAIRYSQ